MKNTIIAILAIVLIAVVSVSAYSYAWTRYGVFYNNDAEYPYYPYYYNSYSQDMVYPAYWNEEPVTSDMLYTYGSAQQPDTLYPYSLQTSSRLCGLVDGKPYGCNYGYLCDYSQTNLQGVGACVSAQQIANY